MPVALMMLAALQRAMPLFRRFIDTMPRAALPLLLVSTSYRFIAMLTLMLAAADAMLRVATRARYMLLLLCCITC